MHDSWIVTDDSELAEHQKDVIEQIIVNKGKIDTAIANIGTNGGNINTAISGISTAISSIETNDDKIEAVQQQVVEAHAHIEALIGEPSDIPSINNRKRNGVKNIFRRPGLLLC
jgi:hypothetical protein